VLSGDGEAVAYRLEPGQPRLARDLSSSWPAPGRGAHGRLIDADAAGERVTARLRAHAMATAIAGEVTGEATETLVAVAMDGKVIRNTMGPCRAVPGRAVPGRAVPGLGERAHPSAGSPNETCGPGQRMS
jgi:hypothetical protein